MTIRAAIFDMDGTIANTVYLTIDALQTAIRRVTGREYSNEEILEQFGPIEIGIIRNLVEEKDVEKTMAEYVKYFMDCFRNQVKRIEGIESMLAALKASGLKIGLFTGRSIEVTMKILQAADYLKYFDVVIAGDDTNNPKPDPEGIFLAMKRLGVGSDETVYTGDFDVDIQASRAAGVYSGLALWAENADEKLLELKPDASFKHPDEFIKWVESIS